MKKYIIILFLIVFIGSLLRLYRLGNIPVGLEWDEVGLGYDAYSILKTGRDQFGIFLPNSFRSLDDYKPPLYVYSAIPGIAIFGLTEFATRLPSAIFGIAAVILVYLLVLLLFENQNVKYKQLISLFSSLFLAVSPWHLQFSRAAFETNLSVTVTLSAVICFLYGIRGHIKTYYLSAFFFGLALFSYHSTRVVTPILLISLLLILRKNLPSFKKTVIFLLIYGFFIFSFIPIAISPDAQIRFRVTNDLNYETNETKSSMMIYQDSKIGADFLGKVFHNRRTSVINYENFLKIVSNYFSHFSPEYLVARGDVPLHHAPGFGMIFFFEYIFIFAGILVFLFKLKNRTNLILLIWFLAGPIPAAVTWQAPHSVRAEIILPTIQIFSALGLAFIFSLIKKESVFMMKIGWIIISLIFSITIASYMHQYYFHTDYELSKNWIYGRKQAVENTELMKNDYDAVWVSMKVDQPYIFWLFYSKYPPDKYLKEGGTVSGGFAEQRNHFGKYLFKDWNYNNLPKDQRLLLVGLPEEFPLDANILKTIYYINGTEALKIASNK
jgi:4-amino-4-deoxy-L-arabinose transferase-like glycosyltransferase